jgi:hypothetical protein
MSLKIPQKASLINAVQLSTTAPVVNQPVKINVTLLAPATAADTQIVINGQVGNQRYIQFPKNGPTTVNVKVFRGNSFDEKEVPITIANAPTGVVYPRIGIERDPWRPYAVKLKVYNSKSFAAGTAFNWTLPGGKQVTGPASGVFFDFEKLIDHTKPYTEIPLEVVGTNILKGSKAIQRVLVWSHYHLLKTSKKKIMPFVENIKTTWTNDVGFAVTFTVRNIEAQALTFNTLFLERLRDNGTGDGFISTPQAYNFVVPAKGSKDFTLNFKKSDIKPGEFGANIRLQGTTPDGFALDVLAYVDWPNSQSNAGIVKDPVLKAQIKAKLNALPAGMARSITLDQLPQEWLTQWSLPNAIEHVQLQYHPPLANAKMAATVVGQVCNPGDIAPESGVYCAMTEEEEVVLIPGKIVNARKGDVILSAGGPAGIVGGILAKLNPPQNYSHSGIMVDDYFTIRHSTANEKYLMETMDADGLDPFKLKYLWPGTITQSVEKAFLGDERPGPDGSTKKYKFTSFQASSKFDADYNLHPPMVVKPDPKFEVSGGWIRPMLRAVAEAAKTINGHYRLYCYSAGDIALKPTYNAPALKNGKTWWGANTQATVCSSFIWTAFKKAYANAVGLEGVPAFAKVAELEATDLPDAQLDATTLDGLYLYDEAERYAAALYLMQTIKDMIDKQASDLAGSDELGAIATWWTGIKTQLSYQLLNNFLFDESGKCYPVLQQGEVASLTHFNGAPDWMKNKKPGLGRAVAPDDILKFWDAPHTGGPTNNVLVGLWGTSEPMIFHPPRMELRKVFRWAPVIPKKVKVQGKVTKAGNPVSGAMVKIDTLEAPTDSTGKYSISINAGKYYADAGKVFGAQYWAQRKAIDIPSTATTFDLNFELAAPPEAYRKINVLGTMTIHDYETFGANEKTTTAKKYFEVSLSEDSLLTRTKSQTYTEKFGGEIRVECKLEFTLRQNGMVTIGYKVYFYEGTTETTTDLDGFLQGSLDIAKDEVVPIDLYVWNKEESEKGDNATIHLVFENTRQN